MPDEIAYLFNTREEELRKLFENEHDWNEFKADAYLLKPDDVHEIAAFLDGIVNIRESGERLDGLFDRLRESYAEAIDYDNALIKDLESHLRRTEMPTSEQLEAVRSRIEELELGSFQIEAGLVSPSDAQDAVPWGSLNEEQRLEAIWFEVDWTGFNIEQKFDVSNRVVEGEASEFWMDGIPASDGKEAFATLAAEIHADEHAARERDYGGADAATYEQRVAEGAEMLDLSDYDRQLQESAERGMAQINDQDKGMDR